VRFYGGVGEGYAGFDWPPSPWKLCHVCLFMVL
jgi:hypothetical protein